LSREIEYDELRKTVAVLRFQPMVVMDELYEEFTTVQLYIAYLMQMASFKDVSVGEKRVKVCSDQEVPVLNLIKTASVEPNYVMKYNQNITFRRCKFSVNILQYLKTNELQNALPNSWIASRILLTIPVTVTACERSCSKLKLIKTYLRSSMSNERLDSLALLFIENATAKKMDMSESIKRFADMKARRKNL
jgi:hypothetical protein